MMFAYIKDEIIVGFLGIKIENDICKLNDIIVLPEYRGVGIGEELLKFCKNKAKDLKATKITLGMIDDNSRLKKWYEERGFTNIGYRQFDGTPFLVGYMEYIIV